MKFFVFWFFCRKNYRFCICILLGLWDLRIDRFNFLEFDNIYREGRERSRYD